MSSAWAACPVVHCRGAQPAPPTARSRRCKSLGASSASSAAPAAGTADATAALGIEYPASAPNTGARGRASHHTGASCFIGQFAGLDGLVASHYCGGCCSPLTRMPFNSRDEASNTRVHDVASDSGRALARGRGLFSTGADTSLPLVRTPLAVTLCVPEQVRSRSYLSPCHSVIDAVYW